MMNLTELFYGTFVPPAATKVRRHNFGLTGGQRYIPPKPKQSERTDLPPEQRLSGSYKKIYTVLKAQVKPISSADMAKKTTWTRNHCSILMSDLYKRGLVKRHKLVGTSQYMYYVEKKKNNE